MNQAEWARFNRYVTRQPSGCWIWVGPLRPAGYGKHRLRPGSPERSAHVLSYEHFNGPVPDGLQVDHVCHTLAVAAGTCAGGECLHRRCVNPAHLEAVTGAVNTTRQDHAERRVTHCPQGHEYTDENTLKGVDGKRRCRTCRRAAFRF